MGPKSVRIFGAEAGVEDGRGARQQEGCPSAALALRSRDARMLGVIGYFQNMRDSLLG